MQQIRPTRGSFENPKKSSHPSRNQKVAKCALVPKSIFWASKMWISLQNGILWLFFSNSLTNQFTSERFGQIRQNGIFVVQKTGSIFKPTTSRSKIVSRFFIHRIFRFWTGKNQIFSFNVRNLFESLSNNLVTDQSDKSDELVSFFVV